MLPDDYEKAPKSFSKVPSTYRPLVAAKSSDRLSTLFEGPRPHIIDRGPLSPNKKILFENQIYLKKRGAKRLLRGCCRIPARNPQNALVKCPVISALWQLSEATA